MRELVEMIGIRGGYSRIDIWNQYRAIDNNISELVKAGLLIDGRPAQTDVIILIAIRYSLSLKLQMEYKGILNYAQETL